MPFTVTDDPQVEGRIADHMRYICQTILQSAGDMVHCIALTGGFGRGEGGVAPDEHGHLHPVNDYDILVVCRRNDRPTWWRLRRRLKSLEPALSQYCGVRVDLACKTPRMLAGAPLTVESYEIAVGHQVLWGGGKALEAIPWRDAGVLPPWEATRYLFNRGAALLWSQLILDEDKPLSEAGRRFIHIAIQKAHLSWGDAVLILRRRYDAVYRRRPALLDTCPIPPELEFIRPIYQRAVQDKLMPAFPAYDDTVLQALLVKTIALHEAVWRWVEGQRGTAQGDNPSFWIRYFRHPRPLLREPSVSLHASTRVYHMAVTLVRLRPLTRHLWGEHPTEHLVRILPLLLFLPAEEVPWPAVARRLGCLGWHWTQAPRRKLGRRLIQAWHPGPPY
ncbi:MAG: hypothetical protein ACUVWB_04720 [Anaerolineae bacterium]